MNLSKFLMASVLVFSGIAQAYTSYKPIFQLNSQELSQSGGFQKANLQNGFGCTGQNNSPMLNWSFTPKGTKSYAITLYDKDAPTGSGWWHWVVYNISADTHSLVAGAGNPEKSLLPAGAVQGITDFGQTGYGGPCPPLGDKPHHYIFTLYALNTAKLDLPANATAAMIGFNLHNHTLAKTSLTIMFSR